MGIQGLISFVSNATESIEVSKLAGKTVAIDSYCWLHKGAFGCAEKLAIGEKTTQYVKYCTNLLNLLLYNRIKPIMVFDGRHLPAKAVEETNRREERKKNRKLAAQFVQTGQKDKARRYIAASIDVTHEMALELIKTCRTLKIDCIVAPYEADAQLAFLNITGIADCVITEDSDLILFGCKKVLFKLQKTGEALLFDSDKLPSVMGLSPEKYDFSYFRRMCILSGCDYLPSLPGIGLVKAKKFVLRTRDLDITESIKNLGIYLNMSKLKIPDDYIDKFLKAEACFQYQYVYDPRIRKVVRLTEPPDDISEDLLSNSGKYINDAEAFQHALGNIDPFSKKQMDTWNPDNEKLWPNSIWKLHESNSNDKYIKTINTSIAEGKSIITTRKICILEEGEDTEEILNQYRNCDEPVNKKPKLELKTEKISERFKLFPVKKTHSKADSEQKTEDSLTFILNHTEESKKTLSKDVEAISKSSTPPEIKSEVSPQQKSPVLNKKGKRRIKSRFLLRTSSEVVQSEKTLAVSSFFKKCHSVPLISSPPETEEKVVDSPINNNEEEQSLPLETKEKLIDVSTNDDEEKPSCSQNSEIENQYNENIMEDLSNEKPIKLFVEKSSIKTVISPKKSLTKKHLVPARRQGLSRTQSANKNIGNVTSQKLLTQFGFVKKPEFKL